MGRCFGARTPVGIATRRLGTPPGRFKKLSGCACALACLLLTGCTQVKLVGHDHPYPKSDWVANLGYDKEEVHPLYMSLGGCPEVDVQLDGETVHLLFDYGCSKGFQITTAVENRVNHTVLEDTHTYHADGTVRGRPNQSNS